MALKVMSRCAVLKPSWFFSSGRACGCLFLILLFLPVLIQAAPPVLVLDNRLAEHNEPISLLDYAEILPDPQGQQSLTDVLAKKTEFIASNAVNGQLDFFLTGTAYWFRTAIYNQSDRESWYFTLSGSLSRQLDIYLKKEGGDEAFVQPTLLPRSRALQYLLPLATEGHYQLYFRVRDQQAPLVIEPILRSPTQMLSEVVLAYPLYSFAIGGLLTLAVYNLLYFVYLRDQSFLALSVFISGFVLELGNHSGLWFYFSFFQKHLADMGSAFGLIAIAASIHMASHWMDVRKHLPGFYPFLQAAFWITLCLIPIQGWVGYGTAFAGGFALFIVVPLFGLLAALRYRQGYRFPFMLRSGIYLVILAFIPSLLRSIGFIGDVHLLSDSMYFILLLALLMLSLTQAEQVRIKSEDAERIAAANEAKDQFLTTMSHELRTPMNAVVSAGRLLEKTELQGEQGEYISRLNSSSEHMLALINDILDLARLENHSLSIEHIPFRVEQVLHKVDQLLGEQARSKGLNLVLDNRFHPLNKQLQGDPTRLQQVLLNLIGNAIKFTEHGEVRLTIIPQAVSAERASLLFEVQDTGMGISAKQQADLFQPFFQLDNSTARKYGGSGLGLAISHKLVQCMAGDLEVTSQIGAGSRFFFTLEFGLQPKAAIPAARAVDDASLPSGLRVLLVDDDEMNRFFGKKLLLHLGLSVDVAESGAEALSLLRQQPFDLVFMDVSMPDMDGYETTRQIRADGRFDDLLIIALTAHAIAGERERCLAAGMNNYLSKPFELETMKRVINE